MTRAPGAVLQWVWAVPAFAWSVDFIAWGDSLYFLMAIGCSICCVFDVRRA